MDALTSSGSAGLAASDGLDCCTAASTREWPFKKLRSRSERDLESPPHLEAAGSENINIFFVVRNCYSNGRKLTGEGSLLPKRLVISFKYYYQTSGNLSVVYIYLASPCWPAASLSSAPAAPWKGNRPWLLRCPTAWMSRRPSQKGSCLGWWKRRRRGGRRRGWEQGGSWKQ